MEPPASGMGLYTKVTTLFPLEATRDWVVLCEDSEQVRVQ